MTDGTVGLGRRAAGELVGTGLLVTAVVGSGIAAARLSPGDAGVRLAENAGATVTALAMITVLVGPVSGAHLNPAVSLADWLASCRHGGGLTGRELAVYVPAQIAGGSAGAVLANLMFGLPPVTISATHRGGAHLWLAEVVATAGLVALVAALVRTGRTHLARATVAAWIGAAYWFTSSTSFANPADPDRSGTGRERKDRGQVEQPATGRGPGQLVADDLPGGHLAVSLVQTLGVHEPGYTRHRGTAHRRPHPAMKAVR